MTYRLSRGKIIVSIKLGYNERTWQMNSRSMKFNVLKYCKYFFVGIRIMLCGNVRDNFLDLQVLVFNSYSVDCDIL